MAKFFRIITYDIILDYINVVNSIGVFIMVCFYHGQYELHWVHVSKVKTTNQIEGDSVNRRLFVE